MEIDKVITYRLYCGRMQAINADPASHSHMANIMVPDAGIVWFLKNHVETKLHGYTTYDADGHWKGTNEPTLVIEIMCLAANDRGDMVKEIANEYRQAFNQESVMVTRTEHESYFVED
jgi:hypothetical protein